jgi:hypothetical protein
MTFVYDAPIAVYDAAAYEFTGKERDAESGLDNYGARYYSSNMGRVARSSPLLACPGFLLAVADSLPEWGGPSLQVKSGRNNPAPANNGLGRGTLGHWR